MDIEPCAVHRNALPDQHAEAGQLAASAPQTTGRRLLVALGPQVAHRADEPSLQAAEVIAGRNAPAFDREQNVDGKLSGSMEDRSSSAGDPMGLDPFDAREVARHL